MPTLFSYFFKLSEDYNLCKVAFFFILQFWQNFPLEITSSSYKQRRNLCSGTLRHSQHRAVSREPGVAPAWGAPHQQDTALQELGAGLLNSHSQARDVPGPGATQAAQPGAKETGSERPGHHPPAAGVWGPSRRQAHLHHSSGFRREIKGRDPGEKGDGPREGSSEPLKSIHTLRALKCLTMKQQQYFLQVFLYCSFPASKKKISPRAIPLSVVSKTFLTSLTVESFIWYYISSILKTF